MSNGQDKDKLALVKYEPQPLTVVEKLELYSEQKREELRTALERWQVADPFSSAILISLAVSAAVSATQMVLTTLLTPKQKFTEERGRRTGELVLNAELGILWPEVYFGALDDGYGGSWVPAIVLWTSGIRKHVSTTTHSSGGKFGGPSSTTEVKETTYDLDWALGWANKGPYRVLRSKANTDVVYDLYGQVSSYEGEAASSYTAPYVFSAFDHASGGNEVTLQNHASGNGGIVEWTTVQSNGAATRQLTIYYRTSSNTVPIRVNINGGANQDFTLPATNEVYLGYTLPVSLNDGVNTVKIQNRSATFNIGIDKIYCFPGHSTTTAPTGVFDPVPGPDLPYDPELPPDPTIPYDLPLGRWRAIPDEEPTGGFLGTMNVGGNAGFAIYPGNTTQLPDPTYEAAIDAQFGAGSTPAYRGRCYQVDSNFYLTKWGGVIPNRTALIEHETIKNYAQFANFQCSRVGMPSADHDFSGVESVTPRGLRIMGQKFEAREPMTSAETVYDIIHFERDGQLVAELKANLTSVATLTDKDFAWSDEEETPDGPLSVIDVIEPNEIDLPRRVDVKYVDLDRDGEPGLQGYSRQVTEGEESATLDLQWTLTREEAQALAQKEVYRRHIEKPCRYNLSWEHLWITPGMMFTASLSDGFTYSILHAKDSGGIGVRECEGIILDEPIFTQSAVVDPYGYEQPVVPIPAMTVALFLDTPLLRDGDETNNNGIGWYITGTPRTNSGQTWQGYTAHVQRNGEWYQIAESTLPGTIGTVVSVADLSEDTTVVDHAGVITVDLYGTDATLSSVTEDDLDGGANPALMGDMVFQFATATKLGGFDNRWELSVLLNGRRGTERYVTDDFTGKRFVFLDSAVKFVPAMLDDLNVERNYVAVTSGQSLDDAAVIPFTWTGRTKQPYPTTDHVGERDSAGSLLIELNGRTRIGGGLRSYQAGATNEETEEYRIQILTSGGLATLPNGRERILPVFVGMPQAAALITVSEGLGKYDYINENTMEVSGSDLSVTGRALQEIEYPGNYVEAILKSTGDGVAGLALYDVGTMTRRYSILAVGGLAEGLYVQLESATLTNVGEYSAGDDAKVRLTLSGSEVRVTQDTPLGRQLLHVFPVAPVFPLVPVATATSADSGYARVRSMVLTTIPFPKTVYSATQQEEDFGSVQSEIWMDIWQHSVLTGPGPKTRAAF